MVEVGGEVRVIWVPNNGLEKENGKQSNEWQQQYALPLFFGVEVYHPLKIEWKIEGKQYQYT